MQEGPCGNCSCFLSQKGFCNGSPHLVPSTDRIGGIVVTGPRPLQAWQPVRSLGIHLSNCTGLVYWIDVTLVSGSTYTVNVYLDNEQQTCYSDAITLTSLATLNLQSHWGSGVIFSNMDVTAKA